MIDANSKLKSVICGAMLLSLPVHSFVHTFDRHNEKPSCVVPSHSSFIMMDCRTKPKSVTRLQYKEDGFTTGPFGQPATSAEEDIELTRQVILDHIAREICQMKEINNSYQPPPTAATEAPDAAGSKKETSTGSRSGDSTTTTHSNLSSATTNVTKKRLPSSKDVRLTRQVILDHISMEMTDPKPTAEAMQSTPNESQSQAGTEKPLKEENSNKSPVRRAGVVGVSISPIGFLLLVSTSHRLPDLPNASASSKTGGTKSQSKMVVPLRMSSAPSDIATTNSTEALTTIQLLWGIDMAAAGVLEPDALQTLVALYCSEDDENHLYDDPTLPPDDQCNPTEEGCIISIEDELGLGSFDSLSQSTLVSDSVGNIRLLDENADTVGYVNKVIAESLPEGKSFEEASKSTRARVMFPTITLDQVRIESVMPGAIVNVGDSTAQSARGIGIKPPPLKLVLEVTVAGSKHLEIPFYSETTSLEQVEGLSGATKAEIERSSSILREMSMLYDPDASANFLVLALALRYKVPTTISADLLDILADQFQSGNIHSIPAIVTSVGNYDTAISRLLPDWRSLADLREQPERVSKNINQSYEVHKLQGALRIATKKGDLAAMEKIRAALDELDGFDDLPTAKLKNDGDMNDEGDSDDHIESGPSSI